MSNTTSTNHAAGSHSASTFINARWLMPLCVLCGVWAGAPVAGMLLWRRGKKRTGLSLGCAGGGIGTGFLVFLLLWDTEWYWAALLAAGVHIVGGVVLSLIVNGARRAGHHDALSATKQGSGPVRHILVGIGCGIILLSLMGSIATGLYILLMDRLLSPFLPVAPDAMEALGRWVLITVLLVVSGGICGGVVGRLRPTVSPKYAALSTAVFLVIFLSWFASFEIVFGIPGYHASMLTSGSFLEALASSVIMSVVVGTWWWIVLFLFVVNGSDTRSIIGRLVLVIVLNVSTAVCATIYFGYPAKLFLSLGTTCERQAQVGSALFCYERALHKKPDEKLSSYLQYRLALLHHKLGHDEQARKGFNRVVAHYTANDDLVAKASAFLDNLEQGENKPRIVLPGVETRTEHRGAYCVPNSMALVMRFWGASVSPRDIGERITGLTSGTIIVDQAWYAVKKGFRHDFLPCAGLDDIKMCIDAGFPVLVYVPAHVFVIFGYDESLGTFVTYDVATRDVWEDYIQKDFVRAWKKQAATMVLVYPPDKQRDLPLSIRQRTRALSDRFLHYHLHYLDAPMDAVSIPHLLAAARPDGKFFIPVTALYYQFPHLRDTLASQFPTSTMINHIEAFFGKDFDEGVHLWGQYHSDYGIWPDQALYHAVDYCIDRGYGKSVEKLLMTIDERGKLSDGMLYRLGILDLAAGDFSRALDRLGRAGDRRGTFYTALAHISQGNQREAVPHLQRTVRNGLREFEESHYFQPLDLDTYGYPASSLGNRLLTAMGDYGESREELEQTWWEWSFAFPFDAAVAASLEKLYNDRLTRLNKEQDARIIREIQRKRDVVGHRAKVYSEE